MKIVFLIFSFLVLCGHILSSQEPAFNLAYCSRFSIIAEDAGLQTFEKKPKVYVTYTYKGRNVSKAVRVVTKDYPCDPIECDWNINIPAGKYQLFLEAVSGGVKQAPVLVTSDLNVMPPTIQAISTAEAASGMTITVTGTYFGTVKPKAWIQTVLPDGGKTLKKNCSIKTPLPYPDGKDNAGKSCMDINTGESGFTFFIPNNIPSGSWVFNLQNKVAADSSALTVAVPVITAITPDSGALGDQILVTGNFFGQNKPKLSLRYDDPKTGKAKSVNCTIKTPLEYPDAKDHGGKSCMDLATGESKIIFYVPSGLKDVACVFHLSSPSGDDTGDFTPTFNISGKITRGTMQDINVSLRKDGVEIESVVSDSAGAFKFTGLHNGDYVLVPSLAKSFFFPYSADAAVLDRNVDNVVFVSNPLGSYLVIDVSGGFLADSYPFQYYSPENAPVDLFCSDEYRTDKIVLFQILNGSGKTFTIGSPTTELGRVGNENQHKVTLTRSYYIGVFEITQKQYRNVTGQAPGYFQNDLMPIENVSWDDVRGGDWPGEPAGQGLPSSNSFCGLIRAKTGLLLDLPTEAQWEYACRAGTSTALNTGYDLISSEADPHLTEAGWYKYDSESRTWAPGLKIPNYWGIFDMHGNVWEWALDWYKSFDGTEVTDPTGPATGSRRVLRSGSWLNPASSCRSARRSYLGNADYANYCGFRIVASLLSISGSASGDILQGVKMALSGDSSGTATTGADGKYMLAGLANGNYVVTPELSGYTFSPEGSAVALSGLDATGINFTAAKMMLSINGAVSGAVTQGVTLTLTGSSTGTATSKSDGTYSFMPLGSGAFTVTPSLSGYNFTPASRAVTLSTGSAVNVDFTSEVQLSALELN